MEDAIDRARACCARLTAAGEADRFLQSRLAANGDDFIAWWEEDPDAGSEQDIGQFRAASFYAAHQALPRLEQAQVLVLPAGGFDLPGGDPEVALSAIVNLALPSDALWVQPDGPVEIGGDEIGGLALGGALCWREGSELDIVPFASQDGDESPLCHTIVDPTVDPEGPVMLHPGAVRVAKDGVILSATSVASQTLSGAFVRTGARAQAFVAGALWAHERAGS